MGINTKLKHYSSPSRCTERSLTNSKIKLYYLALQIQSAKHTQAIPIFPVSSIKRFSSINACFEIN